MCRRVSLHTTIDLIENDGESPVNSAQMIPGQQRVQRVCPHRSIEQFGEARAKQVREAIERRKSDQTTLRQRHKNGHLVVSTLTKGAPIVQMYRKREVAQAAHLLVVVAVHIAGDEVKERHVNEVEKELVHEFGVLEELLGAVAVVDLVENTFIIIKWLCLFYYVFHFSFPFPYINVM